MCPPASDYSDSDDSLHMRQVNATISNARLLKALLDCMSEAVLVMDHTGAEIVRNRAFDRLHPTSTHSVAVDQWSSFFGIYLPGGQTLCPTDQLPMVRVLRGETCDEIELEYVGRDYPHGLPISVTGRPLLDAEKIVGGIIVIRDNSSRRKISEALQDSEEQYQSVVESLAEGVVIHAADGSIIASNDRAAEILGVSREQIAGRNSLDPRWAAIHEDGSPFPGEDHPAMVVLRSGQPLFNTIMGVQTPSGSLTWINVNAVPIRSAKGSTKGVVASFHEITESKNLNERLKERTQKLSELNEQLQLEVVSRLAIEQQYRAVVEDQTEVVCRLRADGSFIFVNEVFCRTFGKSHHELLGQKWYPVAHPEDVPMIVKKLESLSTDSPIVVVENRVINADGKVRWMEFANRGLFNTDGELVEIQAVGRDITDRKKFEEQLKNSLQEKEILLREIHHRVKNNLQIISTLLDLQSSYTQDQAAIQMFHESRGRVRTMALIHENLYRNRDMAHVNVRENISQLADQLRTSYDARGVEIVIDVGPAELHIDAAITCGLLVNELLSNCLKHAFGQPAVGSATVSMHLNASSSFVLSVADNGVGFPESLDFYDTKSFGMKLIHMLARQLRGTVELQRGHGTKITVTFPAVSPTARGL